MTDLRNLTMQDVAGLCGLPEPCGLESAQVLRVSSPFDYPAQAALYASTVQAYGKAAALTQHH